MILSLIAACGTGCGVCTDATTCTTCSVGFHTPNTATAGECEGKNQMTIPYLSGLNSIGLVYSLNLVSKQ